MKKLFMLSGIVALLSLSMFMPAQAFYVNVGGVSPCFTSTLDSGQVELSWPARSNPGVSYEVVSNNNTSFVPTGPGYFQFTVTASNCIATNGNWKIIEKTNGLKTDSGIAVVNITPPAILRTVAVTPGPLVQIYPWQKVNLSLSPTSSCYAYKWFKSSTGSGNWSQVSGATSATYKTGNPAYYYAEISDGQTAAQSAPVRVKWKLGCYFKTINQVDPTESVSVSNSNRSVFALMEGVESDYVQIYDAHGRCLISRAVYPDTEISFEHLSTGTYIITTATGISQKVVVIK